MIEKLIVPNELGPMAKRHMAVRLAAGTTPTVDIVQGRGVQRMDLATGASILGAVTGIASFILSAYQQANKAKESDKWTIQSLEELLRVEAAELAGSQPMRVTKFVDLKAFLAGTADSCFVLGEIDDEEYAFMVSKHGTVMRVALNADLGESGKEGLHNKAMQPTGEDASG